MLSTFEKGILELIRCALNGGEPALAEDFDFEASYSFAQERQITPLLYYGAVNNPQFMDTMVGKKFFKSTINMSFYCGEQDEIINGLCREFKENGIEYMLVKGTVIRSLYPYPEMRLMSDADILIKEEKYAEIKHIMQDLGFCEEYESDHEFVWKKGGFTVELHKSIVPTHSKDFYKYYGDGWRMAKRRDEKTGAFLMSDEDSFIFNFVHYATHYRNGGIGVKHVTDFYVIMKNTPSLDMEYIEKEIEALQLSEFWANTKKLLDVWFNGAEATEKTDFMTVKIFDSRVYGTHENRVISEAVRTSNTGKSMKVKKVLSLLVPSYRAMCQKYRVLKKVPILLPFLWVFRWFHLLFTPSKIKERKKDLDMLSADCVSKYESELDYVGLRFNFD